MTFRWECRCGNQNADTLVCPACGDNQVHPVHGSEEEIAISGRDRQRLSRYVRDYHSLRAQLREAKRERDEAQERAERAEAGWRNTTELNTSLTEAWLKMQALAERLAAAMPPDEIAWIHTMDDGGDRVIAYCRRCKANEVGQSWRAAVDLISHAPTCSTAVRADFERMRKESEQP